MSSIDIWQRLALKNDLDKESYQITSFLPASAGEWLSGFGLETTPLVASPT
jgi:hypothetical protein